MATGKDHNFRIYAFYIIKRLSVDISMKCTVFNLVLRLASVLIFVFIAITNTYTASCYKWHDVLERDELYKSWIDVPCDIINVYNSTDHVQYNTSYIKGSSYPRNMLINNNQGIRSRIKSLYSQVDLKIFNESIPELYNGDQQYARGNNYLRDKIDALVNENEEFIDLIQTCVKSYPVEAKKSHSYSLVGKSGKPYMYHLNNTKIKYQEGTNYNNWHLYTGKRNHQLSFRIFSAAHAHVSLASKCVLDDIS